MDAHPHPQPQQPPERFNAAEHLLCANAHRHAKTAFIDDSQRLSFGQLDERVRRCAAGVGRSAINTVVAPTLSGKLKALPRP